MTNYDRTINALLQEIRQTAKKLPTGEAHKIYNRCDKLALALRKTSTPCNAMDEGETSEQIREREKSCDMIFNALVSGGHVSQLDARIYRVEDMRTPVSHMRGRLQAEGYELKSRWIKTTTGKSIKEYWAERSSYGN